MTRLSGLGGDTAGGSETLAPNGGGPVAAAVNLPALLAPSPLDENERKFSPMPPQRGAKAYAKKSQHVNDGRIQLEPLRPPTAGGSLGGGRASARLSVSSSSGQVSWDSNVLEPGSTISENMDALQALDCKLQFYKALAALKLRDAAQSEQSLRRSLTGLLVSATAALDADALVLYALSGASASLQLVACSKPGLADFHVALETFALRDFVAQGSSSNGDSTGLAAYYVGDLQHCEHYDVANDVDSLLGFSTSSVLVGVLPDASGEPRFVLEARSAREQQIFSKELFNTTLTTVDNVVFPFELQQQLMHQAQTHSALDEVLQQAAGLEATGEESNEAESPQTSAEVAKVEVDYLHSPDVGQLTTQVLAATQSLMGVCLLELSPDSHSCEALSVSGTGFEGDLQTALCDTISTDKSLFQRLLETSGDCDSVDLTQETTLQTVLGLECYADASLTFLPVPRGSCMRPSGLLCISKSASTGVATALTLTVVPQLQLQLQQRLRPILAAVGLALEAKQRVDDLRASTRQKRQLLALCRSHFLVESVRDPSSLVALICEIGGAVFHTRRVTLYVADTIKRELWSLSSLGSVNGLRIPFGRGIAGTVAATREVLRVHRPYEDPRFDRSFDAKLGFKTESLLTLPVLDRSGETLGVLQAVNFGQFPAVSPAVALYDTEVLGVYTRLVAHALRVNSSLIIFAKVQADYWVNRAGMEDSRDQSNGQRRGGTQDTEQLTLDDSELGGEAKHDVASVHSLLDLSGFDEAKCVPRNKWSTFAYACWALGRFLSLRRPSGEQTKCLEPFQFLPRQRSASDEPDDVDNVETGKRSSRGVTRRRTASVVCVGRTNSLINRWRRTTMGQTGLGPVEELLSENFDPLTQSVAELENHAFQLFDSLLLLDTFRIAERTLRSFIGELAGRYRNVPYHSFYHGFDVALGAFALLRSSEVLGVVKELEALSLLLAALGHDADHPGNDNQFEVDSNSPLALCYNDISVLENHHAATTFAVLKLEGCDVLRALSANARVTARTHMVRCILGTDMKHHSRLLAELATVATVEDFESVADGRQLLLNTLIHGADLSSVARPLPVALKWVARVCEEFSQQAARSEELGLFVPPHLLNLDDEAARCRLQMNFIDYLVAPLWTAIAGLLPAARPTLAHLRANREYFSHQASALTARRPASPIAPETTATAAEEVEASEASEASEAI